MVFHDARVVISRATAGEVVLLVDDIATLIADYLAAGFAHLGVEEFGDGSRAVRFFLGHGGAVVLLQGGLDSFAYAQKVVRLGHPR